MLDPISKIRVSARAFLQPHLPRPMTEQAVRDKRDGTASLIVADLANGGPFYQSQSVGTGIWPPRFHSQNIACSPISFMSSRSLIRARRDDLNQRLASHIPAGSCLEDVVEAGRTLACYLPGSGKVVVARDNLALWHGDIAWEHICRALTQSVQHAAWPHLYDDITEYLCAAHQAPNPTDAALALHRAGARQAWLAGEARYIAAYRLGTHGPPPVSICGAAALGLLTGFALLTKLMRYVWDMLNGRSTPQAESTPGFDPAQQESQEIMAEKMHDWARREGPSSLFDIALLHPDLDLAEALLSPATAGLTLRAASRTAGYQYEDIMRDVRAQHGPGGMLPIEYLPRENEVVRGVRQTATASA